MSSKSDFDDVDLYEKLLDKNEDEETGGENEHHQVWITPPCQSVSSKKNDSDKVKLPKAMIAMAMKMKPSLISYTDETGKVTYVHQSEPCQSLSSNKARKKALTDSESNKDIVWISQSEQPCEGFSKATTRTEKTSSKKKAFSLGSCLCKCVLITTLVLMSLTLLFAGATYFWMKDVVEHLTIEGDHKTFPIVDMTETERQLFKDRVKLFVDELLVEKSTRPLDDLVITQDEINGFLCHSDYLRGNIQVTLQDSKIVEEYSLPMDFFPGGKGRFFAGHDYTQVDEKHQRLEMKMETEALHEDWFVGPLYFLQLHYENKEDSNYNGEHLLELFLANGSIFGNVIPDDVIQQHKNLLEDAYADPDSGHDVRKVVDGIERVSIENGKIVIMPRRRHHQQEPEPVPVATIMTEAAPVEEEPVPVYYVGLSQNDVEEPEIVTLEAVPAEKNIEDKPMDSATQEMIHTAEKEAVAKHEAELSAEKQYTFLRSNNVQAARPTKAYLTTANLRSSSSSSSSSSDE